MCNYIIDIISMTNGSNEVHHIRHDGNVPATYLFKEMLFWEHQQPEGQTYVQVVRDADGRLDWMTFRVGVDWGTTSRVTMYLRENELAKGTRGVEAFIPVWQKNGIGKTGVARVDEILTALGFDFMDADVEVNEEISDSRCDYYGKIILDNEII